MLETVVYVGALSAMVVVVFTILFSLTGSFFESKLYNEITFSAGTVMERMVREVRTASSVDTTNSVFDTNPGRLILNTTDEAGSSKIVEFYFDEDTKTIGLVDGGVDKGSLTGGHTDVTNIIFRKQDTPKGAIVKIELSLEGNIRHSIKGNFFDSAVLRGAY